MDVPQRFLDAHLEYSGEQLRIEILEKEPLVTLEEATQKFQYSIDNCNAYVQLAKNKTHNFTDGLTRDEAASIRFYMMGVSKSGQNVAEAVNRALRAGVSIHLERWLPYIKLIITALNKLPSYKGKIWRCTRGNITLRYDKNCLWSGFSSCTGTPEVIEGFFDKSSTYTIFEIECVNGKRIRDYSDNSHHDEVLLLPGTRLQVINTVYQGNNIYVIHLREEGSSWLQLNSSSNSRLTSNSVHAMDEQFKQPSQPSQSSNEYLKSPRFYGKLLSSFLIFSVKTHRLCDVECYDNILRKYYPKPTHLSSELPLMLSRNNVPSHSVWEKSTRK